MLAINMYPKRMLMFAVMLSISSTVMSVENNASDICENIDIVTCEKIVSRAFARMKSEINGIKDDLKTHSSDSKKAHKAGLIPYSPKDFLLGELKLKSSFIPLISDFNRDTRLCFFQITQNLGLAITLAFHVRLLA